MSFSISEAKQNNTPVIFFLDCKDKKKNRMTKTDVSVSRQGLKILGWGQS